MGSGAKNFQSFEILTAANVNSYLMSQSVISLPGTAGIGTAGTAIGTGTSATIAPAEGMLVHLQDLNQYQMNLDGSASAWYPVAGQMPSFVGTQTGALTAQASGASTKTTLTFSAKTERGITESSGIVTAPYTGWYNINGVINWASGAAGNRDCILAYGVSGVYTEFAMNRVYAGVTGTNYNAVSGCVYLTSGNTIRLQGSQTSGSTLSITGAVIPCSLTVTYLGP